MRLLVSVSDAFEAAAALSGGAEIIDAKDPSAGPLGVVPLRAFREIQAVVGGARPVTAAIGDGVDEAHVESLARAFARAGAAFVKVGFGPVAWDRARIQRFIAAAVRGASSTPCAVVAVAYADMDGLGELPAAAAAADAGAAGILVDTANKRGPGLLGLVARGPLARWVEHTHAAGLFVALAGKLSAEDLVDVRDAGADIAGIRTAACDGGRTGRVAAARVAYCREVFRIADPPSDPAILSPATCRNSHP